MIIIRGTVTHTHTQKKNFMNPAVIKSAAVLDADVAAAERIPSARPHSVPDLPFVCGRGLKQ